MYEHLPAIISAAVVVMAFVINNIVLAVVATRKLSSIEISLRNKIDEHSRALEREADMESRRFGETIMAIREKINLDGNSTEAKIKEIELFTRDHFVRRESFNEVVTNIRNQIEDAVDRIEARMQRMEDKLNHAKKDHA